MIRVSTKLKCVIYTQGLINNLPGTIVERGGKVKIVGRLGDFWPQIENTIGPRIDIKFSLLVDRSIVHH